MSLYQTCSASCGDNNTLPNFPDLYFNFPCRFLDADLIICQMSLEAR
jgi:hypothetical protein